MKYKLVFTTLLVLISVSCSMHRPDGSLSSKEFHQNIFDFFTVYESKDKSFKLWLQRDGSVYKVYADRVVPIGRMNFQPTYFAVVNDGSEIMHIEQRGDTEGIMITDKEAHRSFYMSRVNLDEYLTELQGAPYVYGSDSQQDNVEGVGRSPE